MKNILVDSNFQSAMVESQSQQKNSDDITSPEENIISVKILQVHWKPFYVVMVNVICHRYS